MLERIEKILGYLGLHTAVREGEFRLCAYCILALLDEQTPNPIPAMQTISPNAPFSMGATTQQIARRIQELAGLAKPPDREGRDYWIRPLLDIDILRKGYLSKVTRGHYKIVPDYHYPKSQHNFYFVAPEFRQLLTVEEDCLEHVAVSSFSNQRAQELQLQRQVDALPINTHTALIRSAIDIFARNYLPDFEVIYVDDADGERIRTEFRSGLDDAGIKLELQDRFPDAVLWNRQSGEFWLIDAVEHDGEFDIARVEEIRSSFARMGKRVAGFTTVYPTWKKAAARQGTYKNVATGTTMWVAQDAGKLYVVQAVKRD